MTQQQALILTHATLPLSSIPFTLEYTVYPPSPTPPPPVTMICHQAMCGCSQPLFTNTPTKVAGDWFPSGERDIATVNMALFNPLGNAVAQVVPIFLIACLTSSGTIGDYLISLS